MLQRFDWMSIHKFPFVPPSIYYYYLTFPAKTIFAFQFLPLTHVRINIVSAQCEAIAILNNFIIIYGEIISGMRINLVHEAYDAHAYVSTEPIELANAQLKN